IVTRLATGDIVLLQHVAEQHVKIKMRRNAQRGPSLNDRLEQRIAVEERVADVGIREEIGEWGILGAAAAQGADNELEVRGRQPFPTIWSDHRSFVVSIRGASPISRTSRAS